MELCFDVCDDMCSMYESKRLFELWNEYILKTWTFTFNGSCVLLVMFSKESRPKIKGFLPGNRDSSKCCWECYYFYDINEFYLSFQSIQYCLVYDHSYIVNYITIKEIKNNYDQKELGKIKYLQTLIIVKELTFIVLNYEF